MPDLIFCLMGPTASGKTGLACELMEQFPFELISVDSALVYRGMSIGTAKLTAQELAKSPHHLIDIIDPHESYSCAQFCEEAISLCDELIAGGKIPLLVGGTMMYFNALQKGLTSLPQADADLRQQLEQEAKDLGWEAMHQRLATIDPEAALRIHCHDTQRIQRALEVYYLTGTSLSQCLSDSKPKSNFRFVNLILFPKQRSWLHQRIAERFDIMLAQGLIDEVKQLQISYELNDQMPSMRCVGYRQVLEYLQGKLDYEGLRQKGIAATRQLAKRQLTWLRHWDAGLYFDPQNETFTDEIIAKIKEILDNDTPYAAEEK